MRQTHHVHYKMILIFLTRMLVALGAGVGSESPVWTESLQGFVALVGVVETSSDVSILSSSVSAMNEESRKKLICNVLSASIV